MISPRAAIPCARRAAAGNPDRGRRRRRLGDRRVDPAAASKSGPCQDRGPGWRYRAPRGRAAASGSLAGLEELNEVSYSRSRSRYSTVWRAPDPATIEDHCGFSIFRDSGTSAVDPLTAPPRMAFAPLGGRAKRISSADFTPQPRAMLFPPPVIGRPRRPPQEFRTRVLTTAEEPPSAGSKRPRSTLCEAADVAKRTLCNHFPTKAHIVRRCPARPCRAWSRASTTPAPLP